MFESIVRPVRTAIRLIREDVRTVRERDPAAKRDLEVLLYSGVHAVWGYRVAHWLWERGFRLTARFLSQTTRFFTGVEIHPAADLGRRVFVDHGMGVVIGETAAVGDDVLMYHGVTLGGTSHDPVKRHPTVGDGVTIGANATLLGPIEVGDDAAIGAGSVVVDDVPPGVTATGVPAAFSEPAERTESAEPAASERNATAKAEAGEHTATAETETETGDVTVADCCVVPADCD